MQLCPHTYPLVHIGGKIQPPCEPTVLIGYKPAARVTDEASCGPGKASIVKGSPTVLIGNQMAARIGDMLEHGAKSGLFSISAGVIVQGEPTVIIGDG